MHLKNYAQKKAEIKEFILYDSTYMKLQDK